MANLSQVLDTIVGFVVVDVVDTTWFGVVVHLPDQPMALVFHCADLDIVVAILIHVASHVANLVLSV